MVMRWRNGALLIKPEAVEGTFLSPSAAVDAVLVDASNVDQMMK